MLLAAHVVETAVALDGYSRVVRRPPRIRGPGHFPAVISFLACIVNHDELIIVQWVAMFDLTCNAVMHRQVVLLRRLMRVFEP